MKAASPDSALGRQVGTQPCNHTGSGGIAGAEKTGGVCSDTGPGEHGIGGGITIGGERCVLRAESRAVAQDP